MSKNGVTQNWVCLVWKMFPHPVASFCTHSRPPRGHMAPKSICFQDFWVRAGGRPPAVGSRAKGEDSGGATSRAKTDDFARKLYFADSDFDVLDAVKALAEKRGVTLAQIALAWIVRQPSVTAPIVGVSKPEQLVAALDIELDDEECEALESPYQPHPVLGH